MPYKRKDSRFWWVSYTDASGKRFRKPAGTTSQREAKALEKRWGEEANKDMADDPQAIREDKGDYQIQHGVKAESQETYQASSATALIQEEGCTTWTFDQLMLDYLRETGLIKKSAERDLYSAKQLRHFFAGMAIDAIGPNRIAEYKRNRRQDGVVDATVAKELRLLSAAINYARKEWGWDIPNPVQGRCPPESPGRLRWMTEKQAAGLIAAARSDRSPWLVDFIELGLSTGMRSGEMLKLTWERVDLGERLIYLSPEDQKNQTYGSVPINEDARQMLLRRFAFRGKHCPDSQWVFCGFDGERIQSVRRSFRSACERAGAEDFRPHDLRHTFAAWLVQKGVPIRTVSALLRHKDIQTTMRYAHLAPENLREAVEVLQTSRGDVTFWSRFSHVEANGLKGAG